MREYSSRVAARLVAAIETAYSEKTRTRKKEKKVGHSLEKAEGNAINKVSRSFFVTFVATNAAFGQKDNGITEI